MSLLGVALLGRAQLERPEEVIGCLEVRSDSVDLVHQVLHRHDAVLAEFALHDGVVREGDAALVHFAVASLVDEFSDGLSGGVSVGDVGLDLPEHVNCSFVQLDEDAVVDLSESQQLQGLPHIGVQFVDTTKS